VSDCDCGGSLFSHDPDCATEVDRLDGAGYRAAAASIREQRRGFVPGGLPAVAERALEVGLTQTQLDDYAKRLQRANSELVSMITNGHSTEIERLKGKAQGVALALSYLEEIPRCP
jgi:hypothetical protein